MTSGRSILGVQKLSKKIEVSSQNKRLEHLQPKLGVKDAGRVGSIASYPTSGI